MDSVVDPAADGLWDAVSTRYTQAGAEQKLPRTEAEWAAVRRNAVALAESMNLVVMDARHAAPQGTQAGLGELTPAEIDQRIATRRAEFVAFAHAVGATTQNALKAIDKRDADELLQVGGDIDAACEACHLTFWYPNQNKPPESATAAQGK
jgi:cytochrome c556